MRIDNTYRGIVVRQPETGVYLFLWVDHHDEAYAWARNKKCEVNPITGGIQVYEMQIMQKTVPASYDVMLFSKASDGDLLELGVPEDMISFVRSIGTVQEFYDRKSLFPADAFENLSWLAEGIPVDEVKDLFRHDDEAGKVSHSLADALENPETLKSFVVVEGEDELRRIMAEPLEKWRVFLHPAQRKIVNRTYTGSARVLGGAGTGKTVVAMHRAKHLATGLKDNERILFTTFTTNLASDIKDNLRKICAPDELRKIDVINLDAWVAQFLREQGYSAEIIYGDPLSKLWEDAIAVSGADTRFSAGFYQEEYTRIAAAQEAFTLEKYLKASRNGRGTRLDRYSRIQVWRVFEAYQNQMKEQNVRDINTAMYECRLLLETSCKENRYRHVIVDECQDLSVNGLRLLRAMAGDEHNDDLFIVGDAHQRIYKNRAALSQCGINVRGRSSILRINYRTTEEIRRTAFAFLNGITFDDLDDDYDDGEKCQSLTHGEKPQVLSFANASEEFAGVLQKIRGLIAGGVSDKNICVVARRRMLVKDYIAKFTANGLRCYEISGSRADDREQNGIRVATMHRVKGLEFQYVFVVAANKGVLPLALAVDHADAVSRQENMTAEKCLLYVALTRAQKGAFISWYGQKSEFL